MTGRADPRADTEALDAAFAETVRRTGASIGALYLLAPDETVLHLDAVCGVPVEFAAPWTRVPLASPAPVADAVREARMVWVGGQEEMVLSYPRTAMVLPYPLALAAAPVIGVRRWGTLLLMWPAPRPSHMTPRERGNIMSSCDRLARLLEEAAVRPWSAPRGRPRAVPLGTGHRSAPPELAVADLVERPAAAARWTWRGASPMSAPAPRSSSAVTRRTCWAGCPVSPRAGSTPPSTRTATVPP